MNKNNTIIGFVATTLGAIGVSLSSSELTEILSLISTILSALLTLLSLTASVYVKIKSAVKDGKISDEELQDISDTIQEGVSDLKKEETKNDKD